jgi:hypothetical protein
MDIAKAQSTPPPENTIPCEAFKRSPDGVRRVEEAVTFDVGSTKAMTLQPTSIPRGAIVVADGQELKSWIGSAEVARNRRRVHGLFGDTFELARQGRGSPNRVLMPVAYMQHPNSKV